MDQLHAREMVGVGVQLSTPSKKTLDEVVGEIKRESFKGFVCAFDMKGRILYRNDRVRLFLKEGTFFDMIVVKERLEVIEDLHRIYAKGEAIKTMQFSIPLIAGRFSIGREKIQGEFVTFSQGLILKIPEIVLERIIETELERLKLLLRSYPRIGLFVVDEHDRIVDLLGISSLKNLLWREEELLGADIKSITCTPHKSDEGVYMIERIRKDGVRITVRVTQGSVVLSDKKNYKIYLDEYLT